MTSLEGATRSIGSMPSTIILASYVPRRCGIATFTGALVEGLHQVIHDPPVSVAALDPPGIRLAYPPEVRHRIRASDRRAYARLASDLAASGTELLVVQHEYGIFGGPSGVFLLDLLEATDLPVITTLHTILARPTPLQERILRAVIGRSRTVVTMAERGRTVLCQRYGADPGAVTVIPHGVPAFDIHPRRAKARLGLGGRGLLLSLGLLGPHKRVEDVLDALALVSDRLEDVTFAIVGATHPGLLRRSGEAYRRSLVERVATLGLGDRVMFVDRYLDEDELVTWMSASDVFVTPYADAQQASSGTLAYAMAAGAAVVSTPYEHARELLAEDRGVLVPFGDVPALADALASLLLDDERRVAMGRRGREAGRAMAWPRVAARYAELFMGVARGSRAPGIPDPGARPRAVVQVSRGRTASIVTAGIPLPIARTHLDALRASDGVTQFAHGLVPDRSSGACTDDVARALLVDLRHVRLLPGRSIEAALEADLTFLAAAIDPGTGRFRNLRMPTGDWVPTTGSEDAHGRAIMALGAATSRDIPAVLRSRARRLFRDALRATSALRWARPIAYSILGCVAAIGDHAVAPRARVASRELLARLADAVGRAAAQDPGWPWPEGRCTYDNGIIAEALVRGGAVHGDRDAADLGLRVLDWLVSAQTGPDGVGRPIGNEGWWPRGGRPARWDQQPIEAGSLVSAAVTAWEVTSDDRWAAEAERWFAWFLGANDLGVPLADPTRGACRDGLGRSGANGNEGAEATLAWLMAVERVRDLRAARSRGQGRSEAAVAGGRGQSFTYARTSERRAVASATAESAAPK